MSDPFVGKIFFERGDNGSPTGFSRVCPVFSISGFGKTNSLEDVTTFCSEGEREYISGLADGSEFTIEANYIQDDTDLAQLITDVENRRRGEYRLVVENVSPHQSFTFFAVALGWELAPSVDAKNAISFTFKISGGITRA